MKLIVGLGNPGNEYNFTRHNFGFLALDFYAKTHNLIWEKPKMNAIWAKSGQIIWIKPQTFYNNVGESISAFLRFYKIDLCDLLVICDDFDLSFGQIRYREHGSSGGNNGLKSITSYLKTEQFPRLRLGTNNPEIRSKLGDIDFVLGHFTADEKSALPDLLTQISTRIDDFIQS